MNEQTKNFKKITRKGTRPVRSFKKIKNAKFRLGDIVIIDKEFNKQSNYEYQDGYYKILYIGELPEKQVVPPGLYYTILLIEDEHYEYDFAEEFLHLAPPLAQTLYKD